MGYDQDKQKIRHLYEQNVSQAQEIDKLAVPDISVKHDTLLRKIKSINSEITQVNPIQSQSIEVPTEVVPFSSLGWSVSYNISVSNWIGISYKFLETVTLVNIKIDGVLDKIYTVHVNPHTLDGSVSYFYSADLGLLNYNTTYTVRIRAIQNNQFGDFSEPVIVSTFPLFPIPPLPSNLYSFLYRSGTVAIPSNKETFLRDVYISPTSVIPGGGTCSHFEFIVETTGTTIIGTRNSIIPVGGISNQGRYNFNLLTAINLRGLKYSFSSFQNQWIIDYSNFTDDSFHFIPNISTPGNVILDGTNGVSGTIINGTVIFTMSSRFNLSGVESKDLVFTYISSPSGEFIVEYKVGAFPGIGYLTADNPTVVMPANANSIRLSMTWIVGEGTFQMPEIKCGINIKNFTPNTSFLVYTD